MQFSRGKNLLPQTQSTQMQLLTPKILRCKRNLFCFVPKELNLHSMKWPINNVFQHLKQLKFSLIQQFSVINVIFQVFKNNASHFRLGHLRAKKRPKLGSNMTGATPHITTCDIFEAIWRQFEDSGNNHKTRNSAQLLLILPWRSSQSSTSVMSKKGSFRNFVTKITQQTFTLNQSTYFTSNFQNP